MATGLHWDVTLRSQAPFGKDMLSVRRGQRPPLRCPHHGWKKKGLKQGLRPAASERGHCQVSSTGSSSVRRLVPRAGTVPRRPGAHRRGYPEGTGTGRQVHVAEGGNHDYQLRKIAKKLFTFSSQERRSRVEQSQRVRGGPSVDSIGRHCDGPRVTTPPARGF